MAIPEFLSHLPVHGEYPVPFIVQWVDGKPDFRIVDAKKWDRCVNEHLCSICGVRLGEFCYLIGGPITERNHLFFDPPTHRECALYAAVVCPYVSGKNRHYSGRPVGIPVDALDDIQSRTETADMFIYKARTKKIQKVVLDGRELLRAQRFLGKVQVGS